MLQNNETGFRGLVKRLISLFHSLKSPIQGEATIHGASKLERVLGVI